MTYAILSDIHANKWSMFSKANPDGVNSRLRLILNEIERATDTLIKAGGRELVIAGDIFHVRGSIDPEVLNPLQAVMKAALDKGIEILAIPGNHDLASKETTALGSAIQTLGETFSAHAALRVINKPELIFGPEPKAFVPWASTTADLLEKVEELAKLAGLDVGNFDLFIHAGIDGVLSGMPDHGLTVDQLADFGFKRVFAGHYHNRRNLGRGVWSIGALTHQTWGDVGSRAGFLIIDGNDDVREFDTHAPKFIDVSGMSEVDMQLASDGNYVRFRGAALAPKDVEELREFFTKAGALGVSIQTPKVVVSARPGSSATPGATVTLDQSVQNYVSTCKDIPPHIDRAEVARRAASVLTAVRAVEEA